MPELKLQDYMENFKNCIQYEKPYCQAECPFHIDVNDYIEKLKQGNFNSAYKIYRNAVGFPTIVSHICSQPCQNVCPMNDYGGPIQMRLLEQANIEYAKRTDPTSYNIPTRPGRVAIIGSGLAGLGALLRMATKKYETHIFEKSDRIGGRLNEDKNSELFMADIEKQLHHEKYEVHLNTEIKTRDEINNMGFDVVFVATGKGGADFGLSDASNDVGHKYVLIDNKTAWFGGGALIGEEDVYALAGGLYMGQVLEAYIKTGNLNYPDDLKETNTIIDKRNIIRKKATVPSADSQTSIGDSPSSISDSMNQNEDATDSDGNSTNLAEPIYTTEELAEEAGRCLQCQCDFCKTYEDLSGYYDKFPLRIKDEVFATTLEGSSEVKATPAKRLIHTSNLTGITKVVCPKDIDLDNLILAGRQRMHNQEKAPWAFHDFWLRDMEFANSQKSAIAMPGNPNNIIEKKCDYAFFPGCQLGASLPELVDKTYELLLSKDNSTGLLLRCCGAPAEWSGDNDTHEKSLSEFESQWRELGSPTLITACPTCSSQIRKHLPEVEVVSLYEYLDEFLKDDLKFGLPDGYRNLSENSEGQSVFDPCSTREDDKIKKSVRNIVDRLGIQNTELPDQSYIPRCCSFGGQPQIANPQYTDYVVDKRASEGELPYITYCINCRDAFVKSGKSAVHILELILGTNEFQNLDYAGKLPTASERRDNRIFLKKMLLKKYWGESLYKKWSDEMEDGKPNYDFELIFSDDILAEMNSERILEEEVYEVVDYLIRTNRKVIDPDTGIHSGYKQIGYMTYWVSFEDAEHCDSANNLDDSHSDNLGDNLAKPVNIGKSSSKENNANAYKITDVYTHRMEIELEAVWNGIKQDTDM